MEFSIVGAHAAGPRGSAGRLTGAATGSLHGDAVGLVYQWPMR
jgi:hypothetical protein